MSVTVFLALRAVVNVITVCHGLQDMGTEFRPKVPPQARYSTVQVNHV
jgi:hypothetical protein